MSDYTKDYDDFMAMTREAKELLRHVLRAWLGDCGPVHPPLLRGKIKAVGLLLRGSIIGYFGALRVKEFPPEYLEEVHAMLCESAELIKSARGFPISRLTREYLKHAVAPQEIKGGGMVKFSQKELLYLNELREELGDVFKRLEKGGDSDSESPLE